MLTNISEYDQALKTLPPILSLRSTLPPDAALLPQRRRRQRLPPDRADGVRVRLWIPLQRQAQGARHGVRRVGVPSRSRAPAQGHGAQDAPGKALSLVVHTMG